MFLIPRYKYENDGELSRAGIYISAFRARLSVDMISYLIFIKNYSRITPPEKYIDIFEVSTDHIQDQINDMENSVDESNSEDKKISRTPIKQLKLNFFK